MFVPWGMLLLICLLRLLATCHNAYRHDILYKNLGNYNTDEHYTSLLKHVPALGCLMMVEQSAAA